MIKQKKVGEGTIYKTKPERWHVALRKSLKRVD